MKMMMYEQLYRLAVQKSACEFIARINSSSSLYSAIFISGTDCKHHIVRLLQIQQFIQLNKNMYTNIWHNRLINILFF